MRNLFQCWDDVVDRINEATQISLFLDYDGTLTPIVARPEMAVLSSQARNTLQQISCHRIFKLAIISGRSLSEIKAMIGLENIAYAGNHGLEIECPPHYCQEGSPRKTTFTHPAAREFQSRFERLEERLRKTLAGIHGVFIQNKGLTLSVHYRLATQTELKRIRKLSLEAIGNEHARDKLQVAEGKKVLEVSPPVEWNKGKAIEWLMKIYGTPGSLSIFAGDDVTDEYGFEVLRKVGGISVLVGEKTASSAASYYLESPEQLYHWLERLLQGR